MQERLLVGGMLSGWPFFNEPKPKNLTRSGKTKKSWIERAGRKYGKVKHISTNTLPCVAGTHCLRRSHQGRAAAERSEPRLIISHIFRYECLAPRSFSSSYPYLLHCHLSLPLSTISLTLFLSLDLIRGKPRRSRGTDAPKPSI